MSRDRPEKEGNLAAPCLREEFPDGRNSSAKALRQEALAVQGSARRQVWLEQSHWGRGEGEWSQTVGGKFPRPADPGIVTEEREPTGES